MVYGDNAAGRQREPCRPASKRKTLCILSPLIYIERFYSHHRDDLTFEHLNL